MSDPITSESRLLGLTTVRPNGLYLQGKERNQMGRYNDDDCSGRGAADASEFMDDDWDMVDPHSRGGCDFADPGGNSALRAASSRNPRNLPCPTCEAPNRLTPADVANHYQCNACADRDESGMGY